MQSSPMPMPFLESVLNTSNHKHIEKAIELKTKEKQKELYNKYNKLYQVTYDTIKEKKMLLYGGTALNLILPKKDRFYDEYELPDYDFFTCNAFTLLQVLGWGDEE